MRGYLRDFRFVAMLVFFAAVAVETVAWWLGFVPPCDLWPQCWGAV